MLGEVRMEVAIGAAFYQLGVQLNEMVDETHSQFEKLRTQAKCLLPPHQLKLLKAGSPADDPIVAERTGAPCGVHPIFWFSAELIVHKMHCWVITAEFRARERLRSWKHTECKYEFVRRICEWVAVRWQASAEPPLRRNTSLAAPMMPFFVVAMPILGLIIVGLSFTSREYKPARPTLPFV